MVSRGSFAFLIWVVLVVGLIANGFCNAHAATASSPKLKFEWIDEDGTVVPAEWQSETDWNWNDQKLVLQIWFEVPKHLTATLPAQLAKKIASPQTKAPFHLSPDHVLISMQMEQPVALFRFEENRNRFLRISTLATKTNWMRNASCKEASPYLEEVQNSGVGPFFIALNCRGRAGDETAFIEITASNEVTIEIEPIGKIKQKSNTIQFTLPAPGTKAAGRRLALLKFLDMNGEVSAIYNLYANPIVPASAPETRIAEAASEPPFSNPLPKKIENLRVGLHIQFVRSGEAQNGVNRMGTSAGEVALSMQAHTRHFSGDLELPARRMGTGLDSGSPADTYSWLYLGWKPAVVKSLSLSYGLQAALLDSRHDGERISTTSLSPAVEVSYDHRHSLTLAPWDFRSRMASLRARIQFPLSGSNRYAIQVEGFGARTLGDGHDGWYVSGFTLGFTGGFR